jgi:cyclic-di-GMP-binding biofilm dispersal mediator protein
VALAGRDQRRLAEAAADIAPGTPTITVDLRRPEDFDAAIEHADRRLGGLDGVVNAAGVVAFGPLSATSDEMIDELIAVDFAGPLKFMRSTLPFLGEGGFWVNLTGVVAEQPMAGLAAYSAVKAALSAASRAMTRELRRSGIRVLDARPPHTETGLAERPISGTAPQLPTGLDPDVAAARIVTAIEGGERELAPSDFS